MVASRCSSTSSKPTSARRAQAMKTGIVMSAHRTMAQALLLAVIMTMMALSAAVTASNSSSSSSAPAPSPTPLRATVMPLTPMIMPLCPKDKVLDSINPLEFPGRSWQSMTLEQQAVHPINLVFLNLASMPTTQRQGQMNPCLNTWGIKTSSIKRIKKNFRVGAFPSMATEVLVMRTTRDVFVVFRATDDDWVADFDCVYSDDLSKQFKAPAGFDKVKLHKGFWTAYKSVDSQLRQEIMKAVMLVKAGNPFGTPHVWFVGHSLAGALGSIAALRLAQDPVPLAKIGGVISFGSPRVGNEAWQQLYNDKLMDITLRWSNFRDLFSALPAENQLCLSTRQGRFSYRHVGRAVQMCPTPEGLQKFTFYKNGTEGVCNPGELPSIATHLLANYFDGWRRSYAQKFGLPAGLMLSTSAHVRSVMCNQCAIAVKPYPLPTNKAARNDGVVTCVNTNSCKNRLYFGLVSWSGLAMTSFYREDATCDPMTFTCQVPIPGSQTVINAVSKVAGNLTLADLAQMADALVPDSLLNTTSAIKAMLTGSSEGGSSTVGSSAIAPSMVGTASVDSMAKVTPSDSSSKLAVQQSGSSSSSSSNKKVSASKLGHAATSSTAVQAKLV